MAAQSFIMMYQAGEGWQYGKRKISAMSNEEFNKLTPNIVMEKQAIVLRDALPTIQKSMDDMTPIIGTIVAQFGDFINAAIAALPQMLQNITGGGTGAVSSGPGLAPGIPGFITPIVPGIPITPVSPPIITPTGPTSAEINVGTVKFTNYMNALRSMTKVQLQYAGNTGITEQGFTPNRVLAAGREVIRLLAIMNATIEHGLQLPSSDVPKQVGSGGVSIQTLRHERGLLIAKMNSVKARVTQFENHMRTLPSSMQYQYRQATLNPEKRKLEVAMQNLSDFLSKWAGRF